MAKKAASSTIQFHFLQPCPSLTNRIQLKDFLQHLFKKERTPLQSLTYVFCSDEYLLQINKDFLQHNYYTDIITFDLNKKGEPVIGEIYISVERVKDNARLFKTSLPEELHRVIFHGALHLCGYKDKSKAEQEMMRKKEEEYLKKYL